MKTPTNSTLELVELLKSEAGMKWENEAAGLGLIQKQFESFNENKKFYLLQVGFYHEDEKKIGYRPYPGKEIGSYSDLEWTWKDKGSEIERIDINYSILKISKKELDKKGIDLKKCKVLMVIH